jgi:hypothetical protein
LDRSRAAEGSLNPPQGLFPETADSNGRLDGALSVHRSNLRATVGLPAPWMQKKRRTPDKTGRHGDESMQEIR